MADALPPYRDEELPANMPARFQADMAALHRAGNAFMAIVHRYELHRAISRDHAFVLRINNTKTAHAMTTISGALIACLVVSLPALFDDDPNAVSLKRVLGTLLRPESLGALTEHHRDGVIDPEGLFAKLGRIRSRLNRDPLKAALARLKDLRNKDAAHIDVERELAKGNAAYGDVDLVYAVAANIIISCNLIAARRHIPTQDIRWIARRQAELFRESVVPI